MANESRSIEIAKLRRDLQYRSQLDESAVKEYAEVLDNRKGGKQMPPIEVYKVGTGRSAVLHVTSGYHRIAAAESISRVRIDAVVVEGTYEDACRAAARSNLEHNAVRLTNQDKRAAVTKVLKQIKTKRLPRMNGPEIAEMTGTTKAFVGQVKKELNGEKKPPKSVTGEARKPRTKSNGKPKPSEPAAKASTVVGTSPKGKSQAELEDGITTLAAGEKTILAEANPEVEESTPDDDPVDDTPKRRKKADVSALVVESLTQARTELETAMDWMSEEFGGVRSAMTSDAFIKQAVIELGLLAGEMVSQAKS